MRGKYFLCNAGHRTSIDRIENYLAIGGCNMGTMKTSCRDIVPIGSHLPVRELMVLSSTMIMRVAIRRRYGIYARWGCQTRVKNVELFEI
jgi:hypothetical protein